MSPRNFSTSPARDIYSNVSYEDEENLSWEFPREKVHIEKYVGKGAFCVVAKAFVEGLGIVAVKTPKGEQTFQEILAVSLLALYYLHYVSP